MSFVKNDNQQLTLLDSTFNLTEENYKTMKRGSGYGKRPV